MGVVVAQTKAAGVKLGAKSKLSAEQVAALMAEFATGGRRDIEPRDQRGPFGPGAVAV